MYVSKKMILDYGKKKIVSKEPMELPVNYMVNTFENKFIRTAALFTCLIHLSVNVIQIWLMAKTRNMIYITKYGPPWIGIILPLYIIIFFYLYWPNCRQVLLDLRATFWDTDCAGSYMHQKLSREVYYVNIFLRGWALLVATTAVAIMVDVEDKHQVFFALTAIKEHFPAYRYPLALIYISTFPVLAYFLAMPVISCTYVAFTLSHQIRLVISLLENVATDIPHEGRRGGSSYEADQKEIYRRLRLCTDHMVTIRGIIVRFQEIASKIGVPVVLFGVAMGVSILVYFNFGPEFPKSHYHRVMLFLTAGGIMLTSLCNLGQQLEDLGELLLDIPYYLPWYEWNAKNKRMICLLLTLHRRSMAFVIYGEVRLNNLLMVGLLKNIYTIAAVFGEVGLELME